MNHYQILEVKMTATEEEIKKSFRKKLKKLHPDVSNVSIANSKNVFGSKLKIKQKKKHTI